jgi:hypothetical protein
MKRLLVVACFFATTLTCAFSKNDLAPAIRSLDVATVQQIIVHEKFTQREYTCYLNLAEEVVRSREMWILKNQIYNDVTTPNTIPWRKTGIQVLGSLALASVTANVIHPLRPKYLEKHGDALGVVLGISAVALFLKCFVDIHLDIEKRIIILRKKYDAAVTIKQLIYTADVIA